MKPRLLLLFLCLSLGAVAQSGKNWNTLALVSTHSSFDELMGMEIKKATPLAPALALNNTEIIVTGYLIALDVKTSSSHFMFSRYPQSMCFFCGAAGPESAMQVFLKDGKKLDYTKEKVKFKGQLQIQKNDASGLIYFLQDAELLDL